MKDEEFMIGGVPQVKIIEIVSRIVAAVPGIPGNEDPTREGIYLVIRNNDMIANVVFHERIGRIRVLDVQKYLSFANEKPVRLIPKHLLYKEVSSHQSRNPDRGQWGGAIIAGAFVISVSGFKELFDEATALVLAVKMNWLTMSEAEGIANISGSIDFLKPLYEAVEEMESKAV